MRILVINVSERGSPADRARDAAWDIENRLKEAYPRIAFEFYEAQDDQATLDALGKAMDSGTRGVVLVGPVRASSSHKVRDAIAALPVPVIAVQADNVPGDPDITSACTGVIAGLGMRGYELAMEYLLKAKDK